MERDISYRTDNVPLVSSNGYTDILEAYFNVAYYCCCIPYRFVHGDNGKFQLYRWWPQTILSFCESSLYMYIIGQEFLSSFSSLVEDTRSKNGSPLLYLKLIEATTYINLVVVLTLLQWFKGYKILGFVNKIHRFSEIRRLSQIKREEENVKLPHCQVKFSKLKTYLIVSTPTLISLLNYLIVNNFDIHFHNILDEAKNAHSWWGDDLNDVTMGQQDVSNKNDLYTLKNYMLVVFHLLVACVRNMRDMHVELFYMTGILSLCFISKDFKLYCVDNEIEESFLQSSKMEMMMRSSRIQSYKMYRKITRLSRSYSQVYGYGLCCYLVYYIIYYSLHLDSVFTIDGGLGGKVYFFEFVGTFGTIYGFGAEFLYQMSSIKRLTSSPKCTNKLNHSQSHLLTYWYSTGYVAAKAKFFTLSFTTLIHFVGQVMVIFLISVQSKMTEGILHQFKIY